MERVGVEIVVIVVVGVWVKEVSYLLRFGIFSCRCGLIDGTLLHA